uniref:Lymphocyte cytosolic protein 2-like n=1 Tax=Gouania willdenowi TaxID=441366 RepID=A0A8C5DWX8_GOUWI
MSSMRTPCRADVMTWSPQQLSDYLNTLHLSGCDKAVLRNSISGSRFVNLSENDLQKFPRIHIPMISKISSEINKKEKKGLFKKNPRSDDEDGSDVQDYEDPDDADLSSEYEPPPTEQTEETKLCPTLPLAEGDYIGNCNNNNYKKNQNNTIKHKSFPLHNKSLPPRPGIARHGDRFDLDPRWYVGAVTRGRAEQCLKRLQKDGAYLVRNSTRQLNNQPFTLMVFYHNKVYNIQIRHEQQHFLLGTGKVQERFQSVGDMIRNYSQAPLVLIDAKGQSFGQQNQCMLSEPVAGHMTADV